MANALAANAAAAYRVPRVNAPHPRYDELAAARLQLTVFLPHFVASSLKDSPRVPSALLKEYLCKFLPHQHSRLT
jgi:hypothetical protein